MGAEGRLSRASERGMAPGGKWSALIRGGQVGAQRVLGGYLRRGVCGGRRGAGGPAATGCTDRARGSGPGSWECPGWAQRAQAPPPKGPGPQA